ncbi:hypothetical protein BvRS1_06820 [Burkholderia vietnamiensis]|nr:hypothetical protein BvRS1_06820 [Burkholderia vietnamiensis]
MSEPASRAGACGIGTRCAACDTAPLCVARRAAAAKRGFYPIRPRRPGRGTRGDAGAAAQSTFCTRRGAQSADVVRPYFTMAKILAENDILPRTFTIIRRNNRY